jgi:hypothetical protein
MVRTTKQREDTQIEVSVDHQSDQYSVMVTSGGASSRLEAVIAVPGSRSKELLAAGNNKNRSPTSNKTRQRRADTVRYKSPMKEHRNSALIGRHGGAGRRRDRESSCPTSLRTRPPPESNTTTRNSAFTPPRDEKKCETMMRRREASCPPDFQKDSAPDAIIVSSHRRGDDSSAGARFKSGILFQKQNAASRKPNLVTAVASNNKAIFLSRVLVKKKRVVPEK